MNTKKGFTIIELLVVISIIGTMSSIVLSVLNNAQAKARDSKRVQMLTEIQKALELYYDDHGQYPDDVRTTGSAGTDGVDCWECTWLASYYDGDKLIALKPYIKTRQPDPSAPKSGRFTGTYPLCSRGFWYKVSTSGQDYKIAIVGTIENMHNVPDRMKDPSFLPGLTNNISLHTHKARNWTRDDNI